MTDPVIVADVCARSLRTVEQPAYDRPFELDELFIDPLTGAEHYVVRYRVGTKAKRHRHSSAHTMIVVSGQLVVNGRTLGPGGYAHFPGGTTMLHEPAQHHDCTFVLLFDGPFDLRLVEPLDG